ncbi:hypothetical protein QUA81_10125 [Microcoleus sp. F6_B4]
MSSIHSKYFSYILRHLTKVFANLTPIDPSHIKNPLASDAIAPLPAGPSRLYVAFEQLM